MKLPNFCFCARESGREHATPPGYFDILLLGTSKY
jgi:hypothetical protein